MEDNVVLVALDFSSQFLLMPATPPSLLGAPPFFWSSLEPAVEPFSGGGEVFVRVCGPVNLLSGLLGLTGGVGAAELGQPMSRATITLNTLALVSKRFYTFERVLGESLVWSSRIGDIDACERRFLLGGVAL
ncbi:Os07g0596801 [Oryza sativa Japonica Group]|uniref:Os07g0596801 protein n=1 Tax=Oryza sativa subsp. japonica TaxID=39947 RepID=A0A0P0X8F2_ORYSJ|nr:Os07g0596801 [Oryza sativa Japonica Group]